MSVREPPEDAGFELVDAHPVEVVIAPGAVGTLAGELPLELRQELAELITATEAYAAAAQAPNTTRAYASTGCSAWMASRPRPPRARCTSRRSRGAA